MEGHATDPSTRLSGIPAFSLGRLPRITFGAGSLARVPEVAAAHGGVVLLVTGGRSLAVSGRRQALLDGFREAGLRVAGEVAVVDEPSPPVIDDAVAAYGGAGVEVVVGVGGGSVLDAAKAVAGLLRTGTPVERHLEGLPDTIPYRGPAVPLVAVPTTAGTGSEATRNAVISRRRPTAYKRSFRDERLVAADAVVDPELLAGLGPVAIATNGMDAVTQLLESYVSLRPTPVTDALAFAGLEAARDGLLAWHAEPEGPGAPGGRSRMALASLLSGICLATTGLGAVHGLASPLGARYPVPHGAACGATLAAATAANIAALRAREPGSPALGRYATLGRLLARLPPDTATMAAGDALVETLAAWTTDLGVPGLAAFGLDEAGVPAVVADARGSSMRTNPIVLSDEELAGILRASLQGSARPAPPRAPSTGG
jgi:alcohol dehydrogenase